MDEEHMDDVLQRAAEAVDAERGNSAPQDDDCIKGLARELVNEEYRNVQEETFGPSDEQLMLELRAWGLIP